MILILSHFVEKGTEVQLDRTLPHVPWLSESEFIFKWGSDGPQGADMSVLPFLLFPAHKHSRTLLGVKVTQEGARPMGSLPT